MRSSVMKYSDALPSIIKMNVYENKNKNKNKTKIKQIKIKIKMKIKTVTSIQKENK